MVRDRMLECLEAPVAEDYTKEYELSDQHTFRPSPMSSLMVQRIAFEGVYLCLIGNDLPFHSQTAFERYQRALENVLGVVDESKLERAAVDLLSEERMGQIVAQYLVESAAYEEPLANLKRTMPEIAAAEKRLSYILAQLAKFGAVASPPGPTDAEVPSQQLPLQGLGFEEVVRESRDSVPIPENVTEARIGHSSLGPMIFWALVAAMAEGQELVSVREITEIVNSRLVDDHNQKQASSIGRALGGKTLKAQEWLRAEVDPKTGRKLFGLRPGWEVAWRELFRESAPGDEI
jgi:hypothetical protein